MNSPKFKPGDLIELKEPSMFDFDEPTTRKIESINIIHNRYEISYEVVSGFAKVFTTDNIEVVDRLYKLHEPALIAGYDASRCDCGGLKTFKTMDKLFHSQWCKSVKGAK